MESIKQYNLGGCNVSITDGRDLWYKPVRWPQVAWYIHTKFHGDWYRPSKNIKDLSQKFEKLQYWNYWWEGFMIYAREMALCGMIYLPSFMKSVQSFIKIGTGIQTVLRFCFRNCIYCIVGITSGRDLWSAPLKWSQVAWYTYQVSWRSVQAFK
jgi:hypothetical protein